MPALPARSVTAPRWPAPSPRSGRAADEHFTKYQPETDPAPPGKNRRRDGSAGPKLSGDTARSFTEFAEAAHVVLGSPVRYEILTAEQEREQLAASGLDDATAGLFTRAYADMHDGAPSLTNGDLAKLIGHATEPLSGTLRNWR
jgi:hypothetical protein